MAMLINFQFGASKCFARHVDQVRHSRRLRHLKLHNAPITGVALKEHVLLRPLGRSMKVYVLQPNEPKLINLSVQGL